jgi:hypothetical protein
MHDYIWPMGYKSDTPFEEHGGVTLSFFEDTPAVQRFEINCRLFSGYSSMCNSKGDLILYTNGCAVFDHSHEIVDHGDSINLTPIWRNCPDFSYLTVQGGVFLPWPDDPHRVALFHIRVHDDLQGIDIVYNDLVENDSVWAIAEKDQLLYTIDTPSEYISATRHGNGRDWWILVPNRDEEFVPNTPLHTGRHYEYL